MALQKIENVRGTCVVVAGDDIDTDRIIPARYMKCVTFDGLGEYLFRDVRFDENGLPTAHPLNDENYKSATILIGGRNFGCGSSREHAPQAVFRYGFRAIIAESFAEIFFGNATTLGIPCVTATRSDLNIIRGRVAAHPGSDMIIDLSLQTATFEEAVFQISLRSSARDALLNGRWDAIGELLETADLVAQKASTLPYFKAQSTLA
jgi:3-isopropylmalate/(R)-2-methylmalate dehydratase small subunit